MASKLSSERGGLFDVVYGLQLGGNGARPYTGIASGQLMEGLFENRGYRQGGRGILLDQTLPNGNMEGRMVFPVTDGNRGDNYMERETGLTQTYLGPSILSEQNYYIGIDDPVVAKHFSSVETAQEVARIYRICALAGFNPPAVRGVSGSTVNFEHIYGSNLINFFTAIQMSGLTGEPVARKLIDALTNRSLSETVKFQYSDDLPKPIRVRNYVNDLISSYFALLHWSSGSGYSDIMEPGREFLRRVGIDEAALRAELSAIGGKLESAASGMKFRYRDGELANNMMDIHRINTRLADLHMGEANDPIEILHMALMGRLSELEAMQILCDSVRPVDLDGLVSASAGIDDFFRAATATNAIHPLMHEKGYLDGKLDLYLQYIASFKSPKEAEEMRQRCLEYGNEAQFFTHVRRGSALYLKKYQNTMRELLLGNSEPDSTYFNRLVNDAVNLQSLIGYNLIASHSYVAADAARGNKKMGTELAKLASLYAMSRIIIPTEGDLKRIVIAERARLMQTGVRTA